MKVLLCMIASPNGVIEFDLSESWPAYPRIGEVVALEDAGEEWRGLVDEVIWDWASGDPHVWIGTTDVQVTPIEGAEE